MAGTEIERRSNLLGRAVLSGLLYFIVTAISVKFTRFDGGVACLWIGNALALTELMARPRREWPAYLPAFAVAGGTATALFGLGPDAAVPFALINAGESVVGALLLQRFVCRKCHFESLGEIARFLALVGAIVPATAALLGAALAWWVAGVAYWPNWLNFTAGHALGTITFTPLFMLLRNGDAGGWLRKSTSRSRVEAAVLMIAMTATAVGVFAQSILPLLFLPFLPMIIAVFRLGRLGAIASILILTVVATGFTVEGMGPVDLIDASISNRVQFLQFYLAIAVVILLPVAAELKQRERMATRLQETGALHRLILDRTGDVVMHLEVDGRFRYVSPSIHAMAGYDPEALIGKFPDAIILPEDYPAVQQVHRQALASPDDTFIVEYRARRADGGHGWFETHTRATVDEAGRPTGAVTIVREVTRRKQIEQLLARDAATDALTGLANRRAFDDALKVQLGQAGAGCLALFDLDHFKSVNDRYGHRTGDAVLKSFSDLLLTTVRAPDTVARFGGEEFVVILNDATVQQAETICERVRTRFAALIIRSEDGREVRATVSAGIAAIVPGTSAEETIGIADRALYQAKESGRNRLAVAA